MPSKKKKPSSSRPYAKRVRSAGRQAVSHIHAKPFNVKNFDFANFKDTSQIPVPKSLIEQIVGQEKSVEIVRKAAAQKRNVLLVGLPGTGKSLLAQAMSEILPVQVLQDVLIYPNHEDPNNPKVRIMRAGEGKKILQQSNLEARQVEDSNRFVSLILPIGWMVLSTVLWQLKWYPDVVYAALLLIGAVFLVGVALTSQMRSRETVQSPKLLVNNSDKKIAPFFEATGSRAGALLGDVRHDPLQCHYGFNELYLKKEGTNGSEFIKKPFAELWDEMVVKNKSEIIKDARGYEAIMLPNEEKVYTLGEKDGEVVFSRILSINRRPFDGNLVELSSGDKKIAITPEHKVVTKKGSKKAEKISLWDSIFRLSFAKQLRVLVPERPQFDAHKKIN